MKCGAHDCIPLISKNLKTRLKNYYIYIIYFFMLQLIPALGNMAYYMDVLLQ